MGADYFKVIAKDASIMIDTQGYQRHLFAINGMTQPESTDLKTAVDMGNVYLKPLPNGVHRYGSVYEYIGNMPYCQPNQSQKEANCIPKL